ncbi:MAG TPA: hypothetical protein VGP92_04235 [Acidimicrobiia bacterium]|nr:hypothetical protein [Acidimicrobiia bacterium]
MSVTFVQGGDPVFRDREVQRLVDELLAGDDRSFALDDHTFASRRRAGESETADDDDDAGTSSEGSTELPAFAALSTALQSPPFMTAARVVVVREIGNATTEQAKWLAEWIDDPLEGVHLVLVAGGGRIPSALDKAIKAGADVVGRASEPTADVLQRELHDAHLKIAPDASKQIAAHLGDDAGRVPELVELLHSTYGDNASLSLDDVEQYLGALGTAGRFDLTNAVDRGDVGSALEALHRMLTSSSSVLPKPLHPMQVMASLTFHYQRLLRLDDPAIVTKEHAAAALGLKGAGGARFPLESAKRLGSDGLRDAIRLLAAAELDLRGASGLDDRTVIEVLVARLAALSRRSARR